MESVHTRSANGLLFVQIHDGDSLCEYGIAPDLLPIDKVEVWTHEFSERAVHSAILDEIRTVAKVPIAIAYITHKCFFRIPHLMVSLHTPSILRVTDIQGRLDESFVLTPNAFENLLIFTRKSSDRSNKISNTRSASFNFY
jgi:hypothetical protein